LDSPVSLSLTTLSITPIWNPTNSTGVPGAIPSPGLDSPTRPTLIIVNSVLPKLLNAAERWASHFGVPSLVCSCSSDLNAIFGSTAMSITKSNVAACSTVNTCGPAISITAPCAVDICNFAACKDPATYTQVRTQAFTAKLHLSVILCAGSTRDIGRLPWEIAEEDYPMANALNADATIRQRRLAERLKQLRGDRTATDV